MMKIKKIQKIIIYMLIFVGIWCLPVFSAEVHATSEIELLRITISHIKEDVDNLQTKVDTHIQNDSTTDGKDGVNGQNGVGISKIEKSGTSGNVDTYTISLTNGTTYNFTVTNGLDGKDGQDGLDGKDGTDGKDGKDGQDGLDGKDAVVDKVDKDNDVAIGVVGTAIASVSLLGNIILTAAMFKKKKI